ncbi:MAG: hypothetical protein ABSA90_09060 [Xanthobacteraceae bacterium]|jgi:hypothetical protein
MSSTESGGPPSAPSGNAAKPGFWRFLGNAASLGVLGTAFVGLLQYISAYQGNVAKLAKEDLDAATLALTDTVTALSGPLSLQERLIWSYSAAVDSNTDKDDDAYETKSARSIYKSYDDSFTTLSAGINLLARKMEIYLDLPGDLNHAGANNSSTNVEPISITNLGVYQFDCYNTVPAFGRDTHGNDRSKFELPPQSDNSRKLAINWTSAKDNLLTLDYCFEFTHRNMEGIRRWASNSTDDKPQPTKSIKIDLDQLKTLSKTQARRFNDFMSVATYKIEQFRVRYHPNRFLCTVPVIGNALDVFGHTCTPRLFADQ